MLFSFLLYPLAQFLQVRTCNESLNILVILKISCPPPFQRCTNCFSYNQQSIGITMPFEQWIEEKS